MAVSVIKMKKVNITYHAPEGDSKVVEMLKTTFFDGTPVDVICDEDQEAMVENNPHFEINSSSDYDPGDLKLPEHVPGVPPAKTTVTPAAPPPKK